MRTFTNIPTFEVGLDTDSIGLETKDYYIDFDVILETEYEMYIPATYEQPEEGGHEVIVGVKITDLVVCDKDGDVVILSAGEAVELIQTLQNQMIIL